MLETVCKKKLGDCNSCRTGTVNDDIAVLFILACDLKGIDDTRKDNDGCSVLVIMEDRNIKKLLKPFFNLEASWSRYVLKVNTAEGGSNVDNSLYNFLCILCVKAYWESVNSAKFLE